MPTRYGKFREREVMTRPPSTHSAGWVGIPVRQPCRALPDGSHLHHPPFPGLDHEIAQGPHTATTWPSWTGGGSHDPAGNRHSPGGGPYSGAPSGSVGPRQDPTTLADQATPSPRWGESWQSPGRFPGAHHRVRTQTRGRTSTAGPDRSWGTRADLEGEARDWGGLKTGRA